ncbi:MAG: double-stranded uracil-DNA glycosylase [Frankiales bacterium]|nr:double-stranded uracil-DNA glycosylase [Frankiales bacterium]
MTPRPSQDELLAARGRTLPDLVGPGLRLLLVGINPGLISAATGHHFGNRANRLWPVLHLAGFVRRRLEPSEGAELLSHGIGITNLVARATATAAELTREEVLAGPARLHALVERWQPAWVAFLGLGTYRTAYSRPAASVGPQEHEIAGARVWLLPNPSGLNAHYQLPDLVQAFAELREAASASPTRGDQDVRYGR